MWTTSHNFDVLYSAKRVTLHYFTKNPAERERKEGGKAF